MLGSAMDDASAPTNEIWGGRPLTLAAAAACCGMGLLLAGHHPLWPVALSATFTVWVVVCARWEGPWLFALPAAMPVLNFSPWTGWLVFDEFDLLILGSLAGGFVRQALGWTKPHPGVDPTPVTRSGWSMVPTGLCGLALLGLVRGVADGGLSFDWFAGSADAANTLRLSKSLLEASALWPLLRVELQRAPATTINRLARGMQTGLMMVGLAVLWERTAYPGLLDFSARYRTVATFWEMHVGGAAIDVYLALAVPFAASALVSVKTRRGWTAAAALALLTGHACLTTFSRGAYVGVVVPLLLMGAAWWWRRSDAESRSRIRQSAWDLAFASSSAAVLVVAFIFRGYVGIAIALLALFGLIVVAQSTRSMPWRRAAALGLTLALLTEVVAVVGGGTFMRSRLDASERDLSARLAHWRAGLSLLATPADWLAGIGAGRLPTHYAHEVPRGEFSGALKLEAAVSGKHVAKLSGPATVNELAGSFFLGQRISLKRGGAYRVGLRVRVASPTTISLDVCEQHLLYSRQCQGALVHVTPQQGAWQSVLVSLEGPELDPGRWYAQRLGLFSVSIRDTGTMAEFAAIALIAPDGTQLLANNDFSAGLAHWFPVAEAHFLPWHIDNLYLEWLIEHGVVGLTAFLLLVVLAFTNLSSSWAGGLRIAPVLAASLLGPLLVGSVSSFLDVPRVSFLFFVIVFVSLQIGSRSVAHRGGQLDEQRAKTHDVRASTPRDRGTLGEDGVDR